MTGVTLEEQTALPTLERLHVAEVPKDINIHKAAESWLTEFSKAIKSGNSDGIVSLFVSDAFWRDMLALTWDMRTFHGISRIKTFLDDRLSQANLENIRLSQDKDKPTTALDAHGLYWVQAFFDFETAAGVASGIFRIVPTVNGAWKGHCVFTNLEQLKSNPYKVGQYRNSEHLHGDWLSNRAKEMAFENEDPTVLIIGGGQSGLDVAARLKCLDVSCLILEKNARIGDNWRTRYKALCLHEPVWYDHMPYLKFPDSWPLFTPVQKLADWLESYAYSMELNVWTSTEVKKINRDDQEDQWVVTFVKSDGSTGVMRPKYVVLGLGFGGNIPNFPNIPGMGEYEGEIIHSLTYDKPEGHFGKKVVVVGACTAAHDICQDFYQHGIDVTMVQRSSTYVFSSKNGLLYLLKGRYGEGGPPVDVGDLITASVPNHLAMKLGKISTIAVAKLDKEILEGLNRVGFKTNFGEDGSGYSGLTLKRAGGFYLDIGASQLIIDGKIKLKNGYVKRFTEDGLEFEDGSTLDANLVVFATGLGNSRDAVVKLFSEELGSKVKPLWGLSPEGELQGLWRDCGVPNLYIALGQLALCRFHSSHIALQIKAKEVGLFTSSYKEDY